MWRRPEELVDVVDGETEPLFIVPLFSVPLTSVLVEGETVDGLVVFTVLSGAVVVVVDEFGLNVESGLVVLSGDVWVFWSSGTVVSGVVDGLVVVFMSGVVDGLVVVVSGVVDGLVVVSSGVVDGLVVVSSGVVVGVWVVVDGDVVSGFVLGVCANASPVTVITENSAAAANPFDFMLSS